MSDKAIRIQDVTKLYRIGARKREKDNFAAVVFKALRSPVANYRRYRSLYRFDDVFAGKRSPSDVIWALRDIDFDVARGDVIGIIGHNGAGKSTLLKILSRITQPTRGRVELYGRISSLLEVGTGFHHELTGRENIYLNGTILGMRKREVDAKFDEIVAFSGVDKFLDTPVKRYSSGMRVRLAFSVAAHLEPEILIIDEVLAVGDAEFQKKCINKMEAVGKDGRTVLFVSHNMPAVTRLCNRGILINGGRVVADGPVQRIAEQYTNIVQQVTPAQREWNDIDSAPGLDVARLTAVRAVDASGIPKEAFDIHEPVRLEMEYEVLKPGHELLPHFYFHNEENVTLFGTLESDATWRSRHREVGTYRSSVTIPGNLLAPGLIFVTCNAITVNPDRAQFVENGVIAFQVLDGMGEGTARGDWGGPLPGVVRPLLDWSIDFQPSIQTTRVAHL